MTFYPQDQYQLPGRTEQPLSSGGGSPVIGWLITVLLVGVGGFFLVRHWDSIAPASAEATQVSQQTVSPAPPQAATHDQAIHSNQHLENANRELGKALNEIKSAQFQLRKVHRSVELKYSKTQRKLLESADGYGERAMRSVSAALDELRLTQQMVTSH